VDPKVLFDCSVLLLPTTKVDCCALPVAAVELERVDVGADLDTISKKAADMGST